MPTKYSDEQIKVLEGLEPVRKRPGMYIGSTDVHGLHHLVWEIFDNAVDECISGNADTIRLTIKKDNSIIIEDNGRGIPIGVNKKTNISSVDTVFTVLHAGGKFDDSAYKVSGGLHGVGASVVNALSEWMHVTVKREGKIVESLYHNGGKVKQPAKQTGTTNRTGTIVHFKPDPTIFRTIKFNASTIKERVREASFLYKKLHIIFEDEVNNDYVTFTSQKGIAEYVEFINDGKTAIHPVAYFEGTSTEDKIEVEIAMQYTSSNSEVIVSFANSIKTNEGGSHETAFKSTLTEVVNEYARKWKLLKEKDKNFEGDDIREGLTAIISVRVPEGIIAYEGQTKNKLFTQEVLGAVKRIFAPRLTYWLEENKKASEKIIDKALLARNARLAAKKAREEVRKLKNTSSTSTLSGKLTPAQSRVYAENELFIVEGDSAGGTAKLARDKVHQAILPLRGKVLNVEKAKLGDLLANEEIFTLISTLGTGIGEDFNINDLRYGKVIIMTDADTDGAHIQILLLTFFYRFMKQLIEQKKIFIALPPLYRITNTTNRNVSFAWDDQTLAEQKKLNPRHEIQRYKGLGEMSADQLKVTTMNKDSRQMILVNIADAVLAERRISELMGDNVTKRKEWIDNNVNFAMEEE